jgi:hypothetical protein
MLRRERGVSEEGDSVGVLEVIREKRNEEKYPIHYNGALTPYTIAEEK